MSVSLSSNEAVLDGALVRSLDFLEVRPDPLAAVIQAQVVGLKKHYCQAVLRFRRMAA
jgi:hypothetical protein